MSSKEVIKTESGLILVGGLEWRLLDSSQSPSDGLRTLGRAQSAAYAATARASVSKLIKVKNKQREVWSQSGGFYVSVSGDKPGPKTHSLAAAFAKWTVDHPKSVLVVRNPLGGISVVVVLNGLPNVDKVVENVAEAQLIVREYMQGNADISVFADDVVNFPSSMMAKGLLDAIATAVDKTTLIKPIPTDVAKLLKVVALVVALFLCYGYYKDRKEEEAKQLAQARLREADPVPKYLSALNVQLVNAGIDRSSLAAAFAHAERIESKGDGWDLRLIECSQDTGCKANYERTTGTYQSLKHLIGDMKLAQSSGLDLNKATATWEQQLVAAKLDTSKPLLTASEFVSGPSGSTLQNWMVAGLGLQLQPTLLWPMVPGVEPNFKHPAAVARGKIEVINIPLPLVQEVITQAPKNIYWTGFAMQVGEAKGNVAAQVKVSVSGNYYVQK